MSQDGISRAMWLKTSIVAALWVSGCELIEYFAVRREPGEIYPLGFPYRMVWWGFLAGSFGLIGGSAFGSSSGSDNGHRLVLGAILLGMILFLRPRSVIVEPTGVSSCAIFGLFRHWVPWAEVSEVAYDWEDLTGRLRILWWLPGSRITVRSRNGRRIQHTIFNRRQGAFLDKLRRHLPREAFAPGVYDWHP